MKYPTGKFKAAKPVTQANGPTFDENDPAKFGNKGKTSGKTPSNGVVDEKVGPTFTENSTHIPTMNADKPAPMSKLIKADKSTVEIGEHETASDLTASQSGSGGPTDRPYALARSYEKSGNRDKTEPKRAQR